MGVLVITVTGPRITEKWNWNKISLKIIYKRETFVSMYFMIWTFSEQKKQMHNEETLVLKISAFLTEDKLKLNICSSFSVGNIFQGIHTALVLKGKLYLIEKCQLINIEW